MKLLFLLVTVVSVTKSFGQMDDNPFDLPPYFIKENRIKSITEYDDANTEVCHARYDHQGNEIYHEEDDRIIEIELVYDEVGHLRQEVATGFEHQLLLKKRPVYNEDRKIDSLIYELPVGMYYSGFIEKYNYHEDGRIKTVDVYSVPENNLMFTHQYTYASGFRGELLKIRTYVGDQQKKKTLFTKKFAYDKKGNLEKSSQLTVKGDTIAINFYGSRGRLMKEIVSNYYTTPSVYMYSSTYYAEALGKIKTPLTHFIIAKNISREHYGSATRLMHIEHTYDNGRLLKSTKSVKNGPQEHILFTDIYAYSDQNKLVERVTINDLNKDTTTVRFSYDSIQRYIHLSDKSSSYLVVRKIKSENSPEELIIEAFHNSWACKTTTEFDSINSTVTKKRFCKDAEGNYPIEPERITVASFDSDGQQTKHETFVGETKASKNKSYEHSDDGRLVRYESNGQYWKYIYDSDDSTLYKQQNYADSTYEVLEYYYNYTYDVSGNCTVELVYLNENDRSPFNPVLLKFDSSGRVLRKEWAQVDEYSERSISFSYNEQGLCVQSIFSRWGEDELTRYEYEFY